MAIALSAIIFVTGYSVTAFSTNFPIWLGNHTIEHRCDIELAEILARLADNAGLIAPKILVVDHPEPNSFAIGFDPANSWIICTAGLIETLTIEETTGVLAHELAHVCNRDTLLMTMVAVLTGGITAFATLFFFIGRVIGRAGGILLSLTALLSGITAIIVALAIGREREYRADFIGATICGHPEWIISALRKLDAATSAQAHHTPSMNPAYSFLLFVEPINRHRDFGIFATHPTVAARIARLQMMTKRPETDVQVSSARSNSVGSMHL